jgi:signal transduction histidine kinase
LDLVQLAATTVEELQILASQRGLELNLAPPPEPLPLVSDPRLIRLILVNLIGNALKFTERGSVEVTVGKLEGREFLRVRDTGPGIAPERLGLIFEPFEQLEAIQNKHQPGVGLGLALVREMVLALNGEVTVQSKPGEGSTFTVLLGELR